MNRRIFFIVAGAILLCILILLAWWWFLSSPQTKQIESGSFGAGGTASSTTQTSSGNQNTNIPSQTNVPLTGQNTESGTITQGAIIAGSSVQGTLSGGGTFSGVIGSDDTISGTTDTGDTYTGTVESNGNVELDIDLGETSILTSLGSSGSAAGTTSDTGATWIAGGGPTTSFVPSAVNQLNNGSVGGQVTIFGTPPTVSSPSDLGAALAVVGVGTALCTTGFLASNIASLPTTAGAQAGVPVAAANKVAAVPVSDIGTQAILTAQLTTSNQLKADSNNKSTFLDCIARTIGKAIVNQITAGVVNWINGGFQGQPAFVQNFQQFLGNVADQAAGAYIQGSALSFLCSPFSLQIKIAIAQSYANRNAQSCTLSKVINNVNNFMNGDFSQGGWAGLLSFTTTPTNNPFGAYAYAQIGLAGAQTQALNNAAKNVTPGGFISFAQTYNCTANAPLNLSNPTTPGTNGQLINNSSLFLSPTQAAGGQCPSNCQCKTVTPGTVIQNTLDNTQNSSQNMLAEAGVAGSFDSIISALITQLVTKTLYGGLSNLSGTAGYADDFLTPDQQQAESSGDTLLTTLGSLSTVAQDYGQTEQGSISDIQNTQEQIENLSNCWETASTSPSLSDAQRATAAGNAAQAQADIATLQTQVDSYNNNITNANNAIAILQELQTQTLSVGSTADVTAVTNNLSSAQSAGQLISQDQADNATDDRTTLDNQLQQQDAQTATALAQCQAMLGEGTATTTAQ